MTDYDDAFQSRSIGDYLDALASSAPAPGGGSVAGLVGALAAGLGEMVASLTRDPEPELVQAAGNLKSIRASTIASGAADELAYSAYIRAGKMPRETDDEKALRRASMQEALEEAALVPLELAQTSLDILKQLDPVIRHGNKFLLSDAAIAISLAHACVDASLMNVRINLSRIKNESVAANLQKKAEQAEQRAQTLSAQLRTDLAKR